MKAILQFLLKVLLICLVPVVIASYVIIVLGAIPVLLIARCFSKFDIFETFYQVAVMLAAVVALTYVCAFEPDFEEDYYDC